MRHYTKFLFCFLVLGVFFSLSYAQETPEKAIAPAEVDLISEKGKDSIVRVGGRGSGFFITKDKIATNFHVAVLFKRGPVFAKSWDKKTIWRVKGVTAFDIKSDIAILKTQRKGVPLPLADIETLQIGDTVFLAGYPNLGEYKITEGVVQDISSSDKWLKTTVEAYPGNSGSPVLNSKGEAIGIHVGRYGARPSSALKALLDSSTSTEPLEQWRKRKVVRAFVYYRQGKEKYYDGDAEAAITDFNKVIELNPNDPQTYRYRAKAKAKLEDYHAAIEDYDKSIKLNPNNDSTYKERGKAKRKISDYEGAIDDYNQAIRLNPRDVFVYSGRAATKDKLRDYAGAIKDYTQVIELMELNPDDLDPELDAIYPYYIYTARGLAKHKLGDDAGAIEDFTNAIELEPDNPTAYHLYTARGLAKHKLGDDAGAIEDFTNAIELEPDNPTAYHLRGHSKQDLGQEEAAQSDFEKAMELESAQ